MRTNHVPEQETQDVANAMLNKHSNLDLPRSHAEGIAKRILQMNYCTLYPQVVQNFEIWKILCKQVPYNTLFITEEMKNAFNSTHFLITEHVFLSNTFDMVIIGLRKCIEKRDSNRNIARESTDTSSIVVITDKINKLLQPHHQSEEGINQFLENMNRITDQLVHKFPPLQTIADRLEAHKQHNYLSRDNERLEVNITNMQQCIDLCVEYCQCFYTYYGLTISHLCDNIQITTEQKLYNFLKALELYDNYLKLNPTENKLLHFP